MKTLNLMVSMMSPLEGTVLQGRDLNWIREAVHDHSSRYLLLPLNSHSQQLAAATLWCTSRSRRSRLKMRRYCGTSESLTNSRKCLSMKDGCWRAHVFNIREKWPLRPSSSNSLGRLLSRSGPKRTSRISASQLLQALRSVAVPDSWWWTMRSLRISSRLWTTPTQRTGCRSWIRSRTVKESLSFY